MFEFFPVLELLLWQILRIISYLVLPFFSLYFENWYLSPAVRVTEPSVLDICAFSLLTLWSVVRSLILLLPRNNSAAGISMIWTFIRYSTFPTVVAMLFALWYYPNLSVLDYFIFLFISSACGCFLYFYFFSSSLYLMIHHPFLVPLLPTGHLFLTILLYLSVKPHPSSVYLFSKVVYL